MDRFLEKIGECDYDFKNDIFFFKVKDREYTHSIELQNLVIDFDKDNFIVGLQIFDASKVFGITKKQLGNVQNFNMKTQIKNGIIQINLNFSMNIRNKKVNYKPIIFERIDEKIPNSELMCSV